MTSKKGDATTNIKLLRYKGGVTMAILITGVIYHILLAPITEPEKYWTLRNFLVHYIVPWGLVLDTLIFDAKKAFRLREPLYWSLFPTVLLRLCPSKRTGSKTVNSRCQR